jgi:hypothetical protein
MRIFPPVPIVSREAQEDFLYRKFTIQYRIAE